MSMAAPNWRQIVVFQNSSIRSTIGYDEPVISPRDSGIWRAVQLVESDCTVMQQTSLHNAERFRRQSGKPWSSSLGVRLTTARRSAFESTNQRKARQLSSKAPSRR